MGIHAIRHGLMIRADSMSAQVATFQHRLRNLAIGLCGDLNDEKAADVKCAGIPTADRERFQRENERCVKKEVVLSKVYDIFTAMHQAGKRMQTSLQHVAQQQGQQICISKRQVKVCGNDAKPKEIVPREMPFFCVAADKQGHTLQRMAQMGERIERAQKLPTAFTATVYEPRQC